MSVDRFIRRHDRHLLAASIVAMLLALMIALAAWGRGPQETQKGTPREIPQSGNPPSVTPGGPAMGPATLTPTETQSLKLQLAQRDARIAFMQAQDLQRQAQEAQAKAQATLKTLLDLADEVKRENKWPADTGFDASTVAFTKAAPKPPDAAKTADPAKEKPKP